MVKLDCFVVIGLAVVVAFAVVYGVASINNVWTFGNDSQNFGLVSHLVVGCCSDFYSAWFVNSRNVYGCRAVVGITKSEDYNFAVYFASNSDKSFFGVACYIDCVLTYCKYRWVRNNHFLWSRATEHCRRVAEDCPCEGCSRSVSGGS